MALNTSNKVKNKDLFSGILDLVYTKGGVWSGTMTDLRNDLFRVVKLNQVTLPHNPSLLRREVNKIVARIRSRGISVKFTRSYQRLVSFTRSYK